MPYRPIAQAATDVRAESPQGGAASIGREALAVAVGKAAGADGEITCSRAMALARRLGVAPAAVGATADGLGVRVSRCQLGLFGYGSKAEGKSKIVQTIDPAPAALAERIRADAVATGSVTCARLWEIAREARVGRLYAAGSAQGLGIRVSVCQLGCFKPRPPAHRAGGGEARNKRSQP